MKQHGTLVMCASCAAKALTDAEHPSRDRDADNVHVFLCVRCLRVFCEHNIRWPMKHREMCFPCALRFPRVPEDYDFKTGRERDKSLTPDEAAQMIAAERATR